MQKLILFSTFLFLGTSLFGCATPPQKIDNGLCEKFQTDLQLVHETLVHNCSNYNGDAATRKFSDSVFEQTKSQICKSDLDYVRGLKKYLASFHDPHVNAIWSAPDEMHKAVIEASTGESLPDTLIKLKWTSVGVFVQRYNNRYFVKAVDPLLKAGVRVGDEIKSCDGKTPEQILNNEILPYVSVSAREAAMFRFTPYLFSRWDRTPGATIKCQINRDGKIHDVHLKWQEVPEDYIAKTFQPSPEKIYEIEKTSYGHWVKLKSLGGYGENDTKQLQSFVDDAKDLRHDKLIVVDIRGNNGGTSTWGTNWLDALYGYHSDLDKDIHESVFVSPGNAEHFRRLYDNLKSHGAIESEYAVAEWANLLHALKKAKPGSFAPLPNLNLPAEANAKTNFQGQIIVLTDYYVFSSAETFLEQLKLMPNVKQAGIASNASTYFSDVRFVMTQGGVPFDFPTKMDSGDPLGRKSGEALSPDWPLNYDEKKEIEGKDSLRLALEEKIRKLVH